ncbi:MAG: hypothetical protein K0R08_1797 [Solimicrobium sp.]|nr:hypothetical protein [Solimicrobium sp.]
MLIVPAPTSGISNGNVAGDMMALCKAISMKQTNLLKTPPVAYCVGRNDAVPPVAADRTGVNFILYYFPASRSIMRAPHSLKEKSSGFNSRPKGVSEYSTLGGTCG